MPTSSWRRALVIAFVAVQIAVPLWFLGLRWVEEGAWPKTDHPFSWQMYSPIKQSRCERLVTC